MTILTYTHLVTLARRELLNLLADDNKCIRQFMIAKLRPIRRCFQIYVALEM